MYHNSKNCDTILNSMWQLFEWFFYHNKVMISVENKECGLIEVLKT